MRVALKGVAQFGVFIQPIAVSAKTFWKAISRFRHVLRPNCSPINVLRSHLKAREFQADVLWLEGRPVSSPPASFKTSAVRRGLQPSLLPTKEVPVTSTSIDNGRSNSGRMGSSAPEVGVRVFVAPGNRPTRSCVLVLGQVVASIFATKYGFLDLSGFSLAALGDRVHATRCPFSLPEADEAYKANRVPSRTSRRPGVPPRTLQATANSCLSLPTREIVSQMRSLSPCPLLLRLLLADCFRCCCCCCCCPGAFQLLLSRCIPTKWELQNCLVNLRQRLR